MEVSALRYPGAGTRHGRSPLLKLQSDERLVSMVRRGNQGAFELLVARYNGRLLSFCRHMLGSREDAEDVLQDVFTASYNAMLADDRPINVRPWLYRIARNRCLNHLRRNHAIGVDSMDVHFSDNGASTADKVHEREEFRQLLHDIRDLPETQRTALVLRELDALSYEQIAEAMETTVSSVKSLLVRARVSLTEAAEARLLSCEEVREELAEIAEGLRRKQSASVRRHVKNCSRCEVFQGEMKKSTRALAALTPVGPLAFLHKLLFAHAATHSAGSAGAGVAGAASAGGAGGAGAAGAGAAGAGAAGAAGGAGSAGLVTAGVGAVATKAAAGIAAAALVTAGTVAIDHGNHHRHSGPSASTLVRRSLAAGLQSAVGSTHLGGAVGAGPGLSIAVTSAASSKAAHAKLSHVTKTLGTTVSQATQRPSTTGTAVKQHDAPARKHTMHKLTPPPATSSHTADASTGSNTSGGAGLFSTPTSATSSTPTIGASSTTTTGSSTTIGTGTSGLGGTSTTAAGSGTGLSVGTSTAPTGTAPTGTAPTGTAPTGTTTAPTGTSTDPTATSTSPSTGTTTTTPADTATGTTTVPAATTTAPADSTPATSTTPAPPIGISSGS